MAGAGAGSARTFNHIYSYEWHSPPYSMELVPRDTTTRTQHIYGTGKPAGFWLAEGLDWIESIANGNPMIRVYKNAPPEAPYLKDLFTKLLETKDFPPNRPEAPSFRASSAMSAPAQAHIHYKIALKPDTPFVEDPNAPSKDAIFRLTRSNLEAFMRKFFRDFGVERIVKYLKDTNPGVSASGLLPAERTPLNPAYTAINLTGPRGESARTWLSERGFPEVDKLNTDVTSLRSQVLRTYMHRVAFIDLLKSLPLDFVPEGLDWKAAVPWNDFYASSFATYGFAQAICGTKTAPAKAKDVSRVDYVTPASLQTYCQGNPAKTDKFRSIVLDPQWVVDPALALGLLPDDKDPSGIHNFVFRIVLGEYFRDVFEKQWGGIEYARSLFEPAPTYQSWLMLTEIPSICMVRPTAFLGTAPLPPNLVAIQENTYDPAAPSDIVKAFKANPAFTDKIYIYRALADGTVGFFETPPTAKGGRRRRGRTFRRTFRRRDKNGGRPTRKSKPRRHK